MATLYASLAATASRLLGQYGVALTFSHTAKSVVGTTGGVTSGTVTTTTCYGVTLPWSKGIGGEFANKMEDLALAGRKVRYLKVSALGMTFVPAAMDTVGLESGTWQVIGCTPINPAGTPLIYGVGVVEL